MAEGVFFGIAEKLLTDLGSYAVQEIAAAIGVKEELKKLERTLTIIKAVLVDAEEQQLNNHEVRNWLKLIKNASYEADDVLDDFAIEALRQKLRIQDSSIKTVRSYAYSITSLSFRWKLSHRVKQIRQTFDEIAADRKKFKLSERVVATRVNDLERSQTYSFVVEAEVFGRDGDKDEIVELLSNVDGESVVALIGMGGLGKTTLAQLVYGDKRVDAIFESKMWVCVYQNFEVKTLTEKIIKSATNKECPNLEMDQLQSILGEHLKDKKFLLVLDDVWNEDSEKWDKLKFLLSSGAKGSKVVVTTRSAKVASVMGANSFYLKVISDEDCWNLFKQRAFSKGQEETQPTLVTIGKEIVHKCHGVPLAAKTLGSLMRFKSEEYEWVFVRDNDVWRLPQKENDILPALRLSYNHLPSYLKQCFAYCAISDKGSEYMKNNVIESWIAQGFVQSSDNDRCLEDIGNEYVKELMWRSFFSEPEEDNSGNLISFKVHDLVHNLAQDVAGTGFSISRKSIDVHKEGEVRHLNLLQCPPSMAVKVICKMPKLRTLYIRTDFPADNIFSMLHSLRDLSLHVVSGSFPSSIGKLKHLRMLNLESMVIQTLPNSITKLQNLQTFNVERCSRLIELPKHIGRMINLRHIYISEDAPISYMPPGLGNLKSLQTLMLFVVGKGIGCKLNELEGLIHLKGQLSLRNLHNVSSARDCAQVNLRQKQKLETLELSWNDDEGDGDETSVTVLGALQPHPNLKHIQIKGYAGSRFPGWIMEPFFPNLTMISLVKCVKCTCLPPFGLLPSLKFLNLEDMDALRCIEGNAIAERRRRFPSLKKLWLDRVPNLECWKLEEENPVALSLPCLVKLVVRDCPKLRKMPLLPSLEKLKLEGCSEKLISSLLIQPNSLPACLKSLKIKQCDDLVTLSGLRGLVSLDTLIIKECPRLKSLPDDGLANPNMGYFTSLKTLEISNLPKLVSLPQGIQKAKKLQKLDIEECESLTDLLDWFGELTLLRHLSIWLCHKVQSLPDGMQKLTALENLFIYGEGLRRWPKGLENLTSLQDVIFGCSSNLPYLPEQLQQLTTLRKLGISYCNTLFTLPEWMANFTSLQTFSIYWCKNLKCLPEWMSKLTALKLLQIYNCEQLATRCRKDIGEDWRFISHIPRILLNDETIQDR